MAAVRTAPQHPMKPNGSRTLPDGLASWIARLSLPLTQLTAILMVTGDMLPVSEALSGWGTVLLALGMTASGHGEKRILAGVRHSDIKGTAVFTLTLDKEVIELQPGKTWTQLDHYKWVVRGIIEPPQSLNIFPDGSIEINTEKIGITDPEGPAKLEHQINKHHASPAAPKPAPGPVAVRMTGGQSSSGKPQFLVRLDHWGHMVIEWGHGLDREETGLRGLPTLIANGLIHKPRTFHVDPLQRGIEIDGVRYDCTPEGAKRLEVALNTRYAVTRKLDKGVAIEIKENHAASTGFDIHFTIHRAGVPLEVKGHLSQEHLDVLQDPAKCDLLRPDVHLLLAPPMLLFRRRRPDMGEEKIPEVPDLNILHCNAAQLQQALNHPAIRRGGVAAAATAASLAGGDADAIVELRVVRSITDKALLWLECVTAMGEIQGPKAFTHHNLTDLQQRGLFQPHLEIHLSLDHRRLTIQDRQTHEETSLTLDPGSPDEDLRKAGRLLTQALKPAAPRPPVRPEPTEPELPVAEVEMPSPSSEPPPQKTTAQATVSVPGPKTSAANTSAAPPPAPVTAPKLDAATLALFSETDAVRVNVECFRRLSAWLGIAPQDVRLSLPFVFENRQFEVLSFENQEITDLAQLRGVEFYGFYLSHVGEKKIVLVYACNGTHIEWGPDKCVLQPTATSEPIEYKGSALLGLAQDPKDEFVFIVQPAFKQWITPREKPFVEENVQFLTAADVAQAPGDYKFIWPERAVAACAAG